MLRFIVFILFLFLPCTLFLGGKSSDSTPDSAERAAASDVEAYASLYRSMQLEGVVNWKAFRQAVAGYYKIDNRKREVLTLIDFSRPSTAKRLFVFDMRERKVLFSSTERIAVITMPLPSPTNMVPTKVHWGSILQNLLIRERMGIRLF